MVCRRIHLIQAIGEGAMKTRDRTKVLYLILAWYTNLRSSSIACRRSEWTGTVLFRIVHM
jgi:hypothetical protein